MPRWKWYLPLMLLVLVVVAACILCRAPSPQGEITNAAELGLLLLDDVGGVVVLAVQDRSMADQAGILPGDVLLHADDTPFHTIAELEQLMQNRTFPVLQMKVRRTEERFEIKLPLFRNIH
ncbi:MAG: PDZ domain-containing protein [Clostridia bacterium]|nr:PDZ domain-containing protein [Clostridia bacterium]